MPNLLDELSERNACELLGLALARSEPVGPHELSVRVASINANTPGSATLAVAHPSGAERHFRVLVFTS